MSDKKSIFLVNESDFLLNISDYLGIRDQGYGLVEKDKT